MKYRTVLPVVLFSCSHALFFTIPWLIEPNLSFSLSFPDLLKEFCCTSWAVYYPTNSIFSGCINIFLIGSGYQSMDFFYWFFFQHQEGHGWVESDRIWMLSRREQTAVQMYPAITGKSWRDLNVIGETQAFAAGGCLWRQSRGLKKNNGLKTFSQQLCFVLNLQLTTWGQQEY